MTRFNPFVLIVDDEKSIVDIIVEILNEEGYQAFGAGSGEQALEMLATIPPPNLMLVDCFMSRMSGAEFLRAVKDKFPEIRQTCRIVGISGLPSGTPIIGEFESLVDHCEVKPTDLEDWVHLVQNQILDSA